MEISSVIAQEIVIQLKDVIKQQINFINSTGIIIASTDSTRIGTTHEGAQVVLKTRLPLIIDEDNVYKGTKPGINMPIQIDKKVIGVIGITGDRAKVEKNGAIIKKMTEILIREDIIKNISVKKHDRSRFIIHNILYYQFNKPSDKLTDSFYYDYTLPHIPAVGEFENLFNYSYEDIYRILQTYTSEIDDFIYVIINQKLYLFIRNIPSLKINNLLNTVANKISVHFNVPFYFGVGPESQSLLQANEAFEYASDALLWNKARLKKSYYNFSDMDLGLLVTTMDTKRIDLLKDKVLDNIPQNEYQELRQVFMIYGDMNKSIQRSADKLYIHKNSLQYKLQKLHRYTGYDPKYLNDYVILYLAFLLDEM